MIDCKILFSLNMVSPSVVKIFKLRTIFSNTGIKQGNGSNTQSKNKNRTIPIKTEEQTNSRRTNQEQKLPIGTGEEYGRWMQEQNPGLRPGGTY